MAKNILAAFAVLFACLATACGEEDKLTYDDSAQRMDTTIDVRASAGSSIKGGVLPIIKIEVQTGAKNYSKTCGQFFGHNSCALKGDTDQLHAGDEVRVEASESACLGDDCTIFRRTITLPDRKAHVTETFRFFGHRGMITIDTKPLKG